MKLVPTDANGRPAYSVIGPNGELLLRGYSGEILDPYGKPIPTNAVGIPVNSQGEPLPRDKQGNFIYPATDLDIKLPSTDKIGKAVYPVVDSYGEPLPTNEDGVLIDFDGSPIPTNRFGLPVDEHGKYLPKDAKGNFIFGTPMRPTNQKGFPIYTVIGPDGSLLPQDSDGNIIDPSGRPIPTSEDGVPIDNRGRPLPSDKTGVVIFPAGGLDAEPMPTDKNGKPVYPVIGPDGYPLPTTADHDIIGQDGNIVPVNAAGVPADHWGEPLPRNKQGNFIYPASGLDIKLPSTDKFGKAVYPAVDSHGEFLPTNEDGVLVDFDGSPIPTNTFGLPVDEHGKSLPKDAKGNFIFGTPMRPTGQRGFPIHTVIGPNGELLPTEESGRVIGPDGHPISIDSKGRPINNRGETLPTDRSGNFLYPLRGLGAKLLPTDSNGLPIYPVIDSDGRILPTNDRGLPLDGQGEPLPTNAAGVPIDDHGKPLPIDSNGNLVYREEVQKPLATEEMYPVIGPDEELLPDDGVGVTVDGQSSPTDKGIPVGDIGRPLSEDFSDKMIQVGPNIESLPTDSNGRPVYPVVGPDREPLPTNEDGAVVDKNGLVIPTNAGGVPVDEKGVPLPTDENGKMIYQKPAVEAHATERLGRPTYNVIGPDGNYLLLDGDGAVLDPDGKPIPTDESGVLVDMKGRPLPKDRDGNIIYIAKGLDMKPLPTDQNGKPIYSIMGRDKVPLPTNEVGRPVDGKGKPIPTNAAGVPIGNNGKPLPTKGNLYYLATSMPMASSRPVIGPERMPLPTSSDSSIFGTHGKLLVTDQSGWPLDKPLPTDVYNNIIYPVKLPDGSTLPIDSHGRPIYPVIGPNGELLPTTEGGLIIGLGGSPLPTNFAGKPVGPDASLLPTDEIGRFIHLPPEEPLSTFVTNEYGHIVHPIVDTDGRPLAKDDSGAHITKNGIPVELNENHLPIDPDGNVLPTDSRGNYIFPDLDVMGRILPTDKTSRVVIGPNGQLLATDSSGAVVGPDGELLPTNKLGKLVKPNGKPLPTDDEGRFIYSEVAGTHFTEKVIINVIDSEGRPLPTDQFGRYLLAPNHPLQQDRFGRLIGPDGQPLPTDGSGNYVYPEKMKYPNEVDDFGRPLPTNEDGFYLRKDGSIITTESIGLMMNGQGVVLPTDEHGIFTTSKFPMQTKSYQILDEQNQILPTDEVGNFLNREGYPIAENEEGKPVSADGVVLPIAETGHYIFDTTRQKPMVSSEKLLPTDKNGQPITQEREEAQLSEKVRLPGLSDGILPTDEYGKYIYPILKPDGKPYPTDRGHRPIYPIIGYDGELLPTNDEGLALDLEGYPIPTDSVGRPLDENGVILPVDSKGNVIYDSGKKNCDTHVGVMDIALVINVETLNHDSFEHIRRVIQDLVDKHFDLAPDMTQFALVKYSGTAEVPITLGGYNEKMELLEELSRIKIDHIKEHPRLIVGVSAAKQQFTLFGREDASKLMIVITDGQDIYSEDRFKDNIIPMLVIGRREFEEEIKDWTKSYILLDSWEQLRADSIAKMIGKECLLGKIFIPTKKAFPKPRSEKSENFASSPFPTDKLGRIIVVPTSERIFLSTDEYGHMIYPIKDAAGRLLPVNENGLMMDRLGRLVEFNDYGKPIGPDRRPLPTDESGTYIYPVLDSNGKPVSIDADSINEKPLSTDQDGLPVDVTGRSIGANLAGRYSDLQGSPYPFNSNEKITAKRTGKITDTTDYPVIDPDNILLSRDASDVYVNNVEGVIERDNNGKPLGSDEKLVPTSDIGGFIYPKLSQNGKLPRNDLPDKVLPSNGYSRVYLEDPDDKLLATDESGNFINSQNRSLLIEIDQEGTSVGVKVKPDQMPKGQKPIVDLLGRSLPTNKHGDSIYADGGVVPTNALKQPFDRDGSLVPVDHHEQYVSDYMPNRTVLRETELLAEASTCDKIKGSVNIIFMVESSSATETNLNKIKFSLVNFIEENINWSIAKVGMVSYGNTVDVNLDIGNYQSYDDLKESILSSPLIGGAASGDEHAFRTTLQLFRENYNNNNGELIVHIFKTPLSKDAQVIANHLKVNETISILSLGPDQWYRLKNDEEIKKLRSNLCLMLMKSHLAQIRKPNG
ncbi:hypothetical protein LOAG_03361 [Loa loa]|nr:hypothetical protein LOAG_03361 [Loa loa]EFO25126.1 hypothetical protein LOAG_03361 [Loa loa]